MGNGENSELDDIFEEFGTKFGKNHVAYVNYKLVISAPKNTVRSIFKNVKARYNIK